MTEEHEGLAAHEVQSLVLLQVEKSDLHLFLLPRAFFGFDNPFASD
jgi:hypothetical protein